MKSKFAASPNQAGGNRNTFLGGEMVCLVNTIIYKQADFRTPKQKLFGSTDYVAPIMKSVFECILATPDNLIYKVKIIDSDKTDAAEPNVALLIYNDLR